MGGGTPHAEKNKKSEHAASQGEVEQRRLKKEFWKRFNTCEEKGHGKFCILKLVRGEEKNVGKI